MENFDTFGRYLEKLEHEDYKKFYEMLQKGNEICNLTTIVEKKDVYIKHFLDSILPEKAFPQGANCIEVGSGAGFPSIPLMILRKDLQFTLVESIQKKVNFLKNSVKEFNLNATVIENRAEVLAHQREYREQFDVCTARAVARMATLVEYCLPLVRLGGRMIAYKADVEEELEEATYAIKCLGGKIVDKVNYRLIHHNTTRVAVVIEKIRHTPEKYPRGRGKERSKPLMEKGSK